MPLWEFAARALRALSGNRRARLRRADDRLHIAAFGDIPSEAYPATRSRSAIGFAKIPEAHKFSEPTTATAHLQKA